MSRTIYEDRYFEVIAPLSPLNCADDGGHLILIKREPAACPPKLRSSAGG
jgi:hypothetical protein